MFFDLPTCKEFLSENVVVLIVVLLSEHPVTPGYIMPAFKQSPLPFIHQNMTIEEKIEENRTTPTTYLINHELVKAPHVKIE